MIVATVAAVVWLVTTAISGSPNTRLGSNTTIAWALETTGNVARPGELNVTAPEVNGLSVVTPKTLLLRILDPVGTDYLPPSKSTLRDYLENPRWYFYQTDGACPHEKSSHVSVRYRKKDAYSLLVAKT